MLHGPMNVYTSLHAFERLAELYVIFDCPGNVLARGHNIVGMSGGMKTVSMACLLTIL